jgi:hypothetical protein
LEKKVNILLEESAFATVRGEPRLGLEKAKDAVKKERQLAKFRYTIYYYAILGLNLSAESPMGWK